MYRKFKGYLDFFIKIIPDNSKILDLGCGDGTLLKTLSTKKGIKEHGIEIDRQKVVECFKKGISVIHANIDEGLKQFKDNSFDYVILSETLQEMYHPELVIQEMLRVGKTGIVSFPNFSHWKIRLALLLNGYSPKNKALPYEWYDTPNIRVITIKDFRKFCKQHQIKILQEKAVIRKNIWSNFISKIISPFFAEYGIYVITKK